MHSAHIHEDLFFNLKTLAYLLQHFPKKERYNISLLYLNKESLQEVLELSYLLKDLGCKVNILINSFTDPKVIDFITSQIEPENYRLYIPDLF